VYFTKYKFERKNKNYFPLKKAVIDSGTSMMGGPFSLINNILNHLNVEDDCSNMNDLPDIIITL
jgi:hypothetical protein